MKKTFLVLLQFVVFVAVFLGGTVIAVFDPLRLRWFVSHPTVTSTRYFSPEGLILTLGLYVLILLVQLARRRLWSAAPWTTLALLLALGVGLYFKFGWITHDLLG
jgi:hypothetical protein